VSMKETFGNDVSVHGQCWRVDEEHHLGFVVEAPSI